MPIQALTKPLITRGNFKEKLLESKERILVMQDQEMDLEENQVDKFLDIIKDAKCLKISQKHNGTTKPVITNITYRNDKIHKGYETALAIVHYEDEVLFATNTDLKLDTYFNTNNMLYYVGWRNDIIIIYDMKFKEYLWIDKYE